VTQVNQDRFKVRACVANSDETVQFIVDHLGSDDDALDDELELSVLCPASAPEAANLSLRKVPLRKGVIGRSIIGSVPEIL
jgi:hypothetical protein